MGDFFFFFFGKKGIEGRGLWIMQARLFARAIEILNDS